MNGSTARPTAADTAVPLVTLPRRYWRRRDGGQGSSKLTLLAYDALYDAGRPLSLDELVDAVLPHVSPSLEGHLLFWYYRRLGYSQKGNAKRRGNNDKMLSSNSILSAPVDDDEMPPSEIMVPAVPRRILVQHWFKQYFRMRASKTQTLCRDTDGRYFPGPKPPRILTVEGELLAYTPEERARQARLLEAGGETHAILMELNRVLAALEQTGLSPEDRLIPVSWLARRFADRLTTTKGNKHGFTETTCRGLFHHVVKHARFPETKRAALERLLTWAFEVTPNHPVSS